MKKWLLILIVSVIGLTGCSQEEEPANETADQSNDMVEENSVSVEDITEEDIVATIHGHEISGEDLFYEIKRLELIYLLQGEAKEFENISPNVAIQEIAYNHMIHHIAGEKEITVDQSEQTERAQTVREETEQVDGYERVIEGIDEELFWSKEASRYKIILQAEMLISQLMEEVKEEHPTYTEEALRFDAQEDLDEIIQQKLAESDVEIYLNG